MNIYAIFGVAVTLTAALALIFRNNLTKVTVDGLQRNYNIIKERCDIQDLQLKEMEHKLEHCNQQHQNDSKQIAMLRDMVSGTTAVKELQAEIVKKFDSHDEKVEQAFRDLRAMLRGGHNGRS